MTLGERLERAIKVLIALEEMVDRYGTQDPRVLAMSRKLDKILVQLQRGKVA